LRRRDFIALFGGMAACPLAAGAQSPTKLVVGFLRSASVGSLDNLVAAFRQGLKEQGYVEGENVAVAYRWADGATERLPALTVELARDYAHVIAAGSNEALAIAKAATSTIPIAFALGDDPVGLVASINRPGGNITGVSFGTTDLIAKRMEFLHELMPSGSHIGYLMNLSDTASEAEMNEVETAAHSLGQRILVVKAGSEADADAAFERLAEQRADDLLVGSGAFFFDRRQHRAALTAHYAIPAIYDLRNYVTAGGLMSYGPNIADVYSKVGDYVGRILRGAGPAELPVMQPTKFEFVVNLRSAKALGLAIPQSILIRADEVIE